MKKIISLAMAALMVCSIANAQSKETFKERKQMSKLTKTELEAKVSKATKKEAKVLVKEGWKVAPGHLPLEKQLERSYKMNYEFDDNGLPKYIMGDAMSPGKFYDAAKAQAVEIAKTNLAGQIETEVTALIESTVANEQISQDDAESIARTVSASKNLIVQRLGRVIPVVELYKQHSKKSVEVRVTIAYNAEMALEAAKAVIKAQLNDKGEDLHNQIDDMWNNMKK